MSHHYKHFDEYCPHSKYLQHLIVLFVELSPYPNGEKHYKTSVYDCNTNRCKHKWLNSCVLFRQVTR